MSPTSPSGPAGEPTLYSVCTAANEEIGHSAGLEHLPVELEAKK